MNYDQIFKKETLSKLNRQSADNLRRVKEEYNLMDQMGYMRLIQDISQIEEPYKEQLEQLAVNMVKELYPVIDEQGIKIDAGLTDLNGTRAELDEIKVNNPALITPIKVESKEKLEQILKILQNKGYSWGGDSDQGFFEPNSIRPTKYPIYIVKDWGQNKIDFTYPPVHPAHKSVNLSESISPEGRRRVINSITQGAALKGAFAFYLFKDHLDAIDPTLIDKYNEVMKRTFGVFDDDNIIAMMMALLARGVDIKGKAGGSSKVILPKQGGLDEIKVNVPKYPEKVIIDSPETYTKWTKILKSNGFKWGSGHEIETPFNKKTDFKNFPYYLYINNKTITLDNNGKRDPNGLYKQVNGKSHIKDLFKQAKKLKGQDEEDLRNFLQTKYNINENNQDSGITIRARAICFPMLVHEIIKGLYELISLQGFKGDKQQNQSVVDKVDKPENEPHDMKYGQHIFEALNDIYFEYGGDDSRVREYFFQEIYQLEDEDFIDYVENAINGTLTPQEKSWTKQILKEIQHDLKGDDYDQHGLDEIKVNEPILIHSKPTLEKIQKIFPEAYIYNDIPSFMNTTGLSFLIIFHKKLKFQMRLNSDCLYYNDKNKEIIIHLEERDIDGRTFKNINQAIEYLKSNTLDEIKVNKPNPNQQYYSKYPGLEEKCSEYNPFTILDSKMDPGYGYQHMKIFQIKFNSDNRYGLFIWDGNNKSFQEEPGEYEDYNLTTDEVERKFGFKHTISEIKVNKPNSIIYKSKTQDDSFGWLYLNDEIISEFSYLSDGKIKIDEHDYYNSIDPKFRKLFSRIPGTMYGFALNKPFTIKKQDPIGEIKVNNPIGIKAEPRDDPQSPLRNERAFIIKIDEKNKLKLMKGKDYYYLFQGIGENSPKLELIKSFLSKKGIPFTQVASSAPGRVNIHIPVDKIKIKLDESILNKGLLAGLLMTAGLTYGQLKPEYKAKIDSIQKTELSPQDKRAEIQKIVQLNRDEISGKKREEFLRTMKAAGFTNEEEYKKYLVKNSKKKDAGLDGLQVGNANKRGETKGSCSTGETNKGESLKDTK